MRVELVPRVCNMHVLPFTELFSLISSLVALQLQVTP